MKDILETILFLRIIFTKIGAKRGGFLTKTHRVHQKRD